MGDPVTWAVILAGTGTALAVAGAANSAAAATAGGKAQQSAAQYQAQVARNEATIANQNAGYALQAGDVAANNVSMKGRARLGAVKAAQSANGVDINTGSAVAVRAGDAEGSRLDALTTRHQAELEAYGYRTNATSKQAQAGLYDKEAAYAPVAARYQAVGGLLSTASSLAFKWSGTAGGMGSSGGGGAGDFPLDAFGRPED